MEESLTFYAEGGEVIRLEGVLHREEGAPADAPLAILCHPHPIGGGSMDVPLIVDGQVAGGEGHRRPAFQLSRSGSQQRRLHRRPQGDRRHPG